MSEDDMEGGANLSSAVSTMGSADARLSPRPWYDGNGAGEAAEVRELRMLKEKYLKLKEENQQLRRTICEDLNAQGEEVRKEEARKEEARKHFKLSRGRKVEPKPNLKQWGMPQ
jgi:hypothetical protein